LANASAAAPPAVYFAKSSPSHSTSPYQKKYHGSVFKYVPFGTVPFNETEEMASLYFDEWFVV
jgi:hypothetical protein